MQGQLGGVMMMGGAGSKGSGKGGGSGRHESCEKKEEVMEYAGDAGFGGEGDENGRVLERRPSRIELSENEQ